MEEKVSWQVRFIYPSNLFLFQSHSAEDGLMTTKLFDLFVGYFRLATAQLKLGDLRNAYTTAKQGMSLDTGVLFLFLALYFCRRFKSCHSVNYQTVKTLFNNDTRVGTAEGLQGAQKPSPPLFIQKRQKLQCAALLEICKLRLPGT